MMLTSAVRHANDNLFEPLRENRTANIRGQRQGVFISNWQSSGPSAEGHVRFERNQFEVPLVAPFHLKEVPPGPTTTGSWVADLRIERDEDHCPYDNQRHRWMFPRRLRLEAAVRLENYGRKNQTLPPLVRPTEEGDLAIWEGLDWKRPLISIPSDVEAFAQGLARHHPETPREGRPHEGAELVFRFRPVIVSDKGRDLLGVLQLFRSLPEALLFLTNTYLLSVVQTLCPTEPEDNPRRVEELAGDLREAFEQRHAAPDLHRLAKRVMQKTAGWVQADNKANASISYKQLADKVPNELRRNEWKSSLETSVQYLRDRMFLHQGYAWKCEVCQHPNWVHLQDIVAILHCEILSNGEVFSGLRRSECALPAEPIRGGCFLFFVIARACSVDSKSVCRSRIVVVHVHAGAGRVQAWGTRPVYGRRCFCCR